MLITGSRFVRDSWSVMITLSTPSPANCITRRVLLMRESDSRWLYVIVRRDEARRLMTCAICAASVVVLPDDTVIGVENAEYSVPRETINW